MGSGMVLVPSPPLRMRGSRVRSCIHTFVPPSFGNSCGGTFPREDRCQMKNVGHDGEGDGAGGRVCAQVDGAIV